LLESGLRLNSKKCKVLNARNVHQQSSLALFQTVPATKILGAFIGEQEACKELLQQKFIKMKDSIALVSRLPPHQAYAVLRECVIAKPLFLARVHPPDVFSDFAMQFDKEILDLLRDVCSASIGTDIDRAFTQLPLGEGGMGITPLTPQLSFLYASSVSESSSSLPRQELFADLMSIIDSQPVSKRIREMNCVKNSWNWLKHSATIKWKASDFRGALRHRFNLLPRMFAANATSVRCPFCSTSFSVVEWPGHVAFCNDARGDASRNRKHRAIADATISALTSLSTRFHCRAEPREYQSHTCTTCHSTFTSLLHHVNCPARPRAHGPDIKINGSVRTDVIDFTVIHGSAVE
jgi:hypothetical protein